MLGLLREKLSMPDGGQEKLKDVVSEQILRGLETMMNTLKKDCVTLYENSKYSKEIQNGSYDEIFEEALEIHRKINQMQWRREPELMKIFKAKANCFIGRIREQRMEYDRALDCLIPARRWIENSMLQYVIPEFYVEINKCMAKCCMEKHSDTKQIDACLKCAKDVLEDEQVKKDIILRYSEDYYNALMLELSLQWSIVNLDDYGQQRQLEINQTWEYLKKSEKCFKELYVIEKCTIKGFEWNKWYQIQDVTLGTTKGVYFRNLYFRTGKAYKKLKRMEKNKGKKNGRSDKENLDERHMKYIAKILSEEINQLEEKENQLEKELILPHMTDDMAGQGKYQHLRRMKNELRDVTKRLEPKGRQLDEGAFDVTDLKQIAKILEGISFVVSFLTYADVVNRQPDNTMCLGGMAWLLYVNSEPDKKFPGCKELMNEWCPNVKKKDIDGLLDAVLDIENRNMFALNIKAALQCESDKSGKLDSYSALRQSSLKARFFKMENELWGLFGEDEKTRKEYMHKFMLEIISLYREVSGFMNSAIVNCGSEKWKDLQIGHYTRLDVVTKLINRDGDSMYRLHNAHYMNDNREGVLLIDHLRENIDSSKPSLIKYIMDKYTYDQNGAVRSYVYIGSFTSSVDDLDMWKSYGDKGKGVCIQFDAARFFDREARYSLADISMSDGTGKFKMEDTKYPLYMVVYLPDIEGSADADTQKKDNKSADAKDPLKESLDRARKYAKSRAEAEEENSLERNWWKKQAHLIKRLYDVEEEIKKYLCKIQEVYEDLKGGLKNKEEQKEQLAAFEKELSSTIMVIIDLIRFLIKSDHFKNEREYRVIQYSSDPQYEDTDTGIPRLFIPMKKTPLYKKICFGSAVTDFDSKAAYILNIRKNRKNVEERLTWDVEVCKSSIPIREV